MLRDLRKSMANANPWDSNVPAVGGNNQRDETAVDDTFSNMYGSQETILFLVDMSKQMFQKNIDGFIPMDNALTMVYKWMNERILTYPKELLVLSSSIPKKCTICPMSFLIFMFKTN